MTRLVTRNLRCGHVVKRSAMRGAASMTCSMLSRTIRICFVRKWSTSRTAKGRLPISLKPSAWAIVGKTRSGSRIDPNAMNATPSSNSLATTDYRSDGKRKTGLADTAGADQGHERHVVAKQQVARGYDVVFPADERGAVNGQRREQNGLALG